MGTAMEKKATSSTMEPRPFTPEELACMTPSARKLCEMVGKYPAPRDLTPTEIELLRASKRELAALAFATPTRAGAGKLAPSLTSSV